VAREKAYGGVSGFPRPRQTSQIFPKPRKIRISGQ
jgi:hypothetical protein